MPISFPPNLDDGELWLPSDIIPELSSTTGPHHRRHFSSNNNGGSLDFDAMANQLAFLGLLDPLPNPPAPTREAADCLRLGFGFAYDGYRAPVSPRAVHQFNLAKRVHGQGYDRFGQRSGGLLYAEQKRLTGLKERVYPFRVGNGLGRSSSCGGTGVFLPRVLNNEVRKKPGTKVSEQQKQSMRINIINNAVQTSQAFPLMNSQQEITLPQEWTY